MKFNYHCSSCGKNYDIVPDMYLCPKCALISKDVPLKGVLDVEIDGPSWDSLSPIELLPVETKFFPPIPVGNTPLWSPQRLNEFLALKNLKIKEDGVNPTGSLKDRASFLIAAFANKHNIKEIILASTGNAASSMAGIGAASGIGVTIFLPKNAPIAKLTQILQYGANCILVDGNYDLAYDLSLEYSKKYQGINRNTGYNPLTIEGKKTVSLEIYTQLQNKSPDFVFVSTGDGVILSGVYKGFIDLLNLKLIDKIPTIYSVQSNKSAALFNAYNSGTFSNFKADTIADSISVDNPRNGYHALNLLNKHNGEVITVSDDEILEAQHILASKSGLFTEPAGATSLAGLIKVKNNLPKDANITIITTGNGLKDITSAQIKVQIPDKSIKNLEELIIH